MLGVQLVHGHLPQAMLQLCCTLVQSHAMYGCELWSTEFLLTSPYAACQETTPITSTRHPSLHFATVFMRGAQYYAI
jgi:hypothetical protein